MNTQNKKSVFQLLKYFLFLGSTGFGGPLALIQDMRNYFVTQNKDLESKEFEQAFTLIKAMPGPIAFQMASFCGYRLAGFWGAFVSALGLVFPAFILMILTGYYYQQLIQYVWIKNILFGIQYSVAAIIIYGLKNLFLTNKNSKLFLSLILVVGYLFVFQSTPESLLILFSGFFVVLINRNNNLRLTSFFPVALTITEADKVISIFKTCFMAGALIFGTGLAVFPFLNSEFVEKYGWITLSVFNDGVSFGQMTPGPVTISATFMGYQMAGLFGALAATLGIFLPSFFHMTTWFPKAMSWLSTKKWINEFILGSSAAVIACIMATVYDMNKYQLVKPMFWVTFIGTFFVLIRYPKLSILTIIAVSGVINLLILSI